MKDTLYIGAYTNIAYGGSGQAEGLYVYQMAPDTGRLELLQTVDAGPNPSFLAALPGGRYVYAANEEAEGQASALRRDADGRLALLNRQPVRGAGPCYISFDPEYRWLLAACYSSGSFSVLPIDEDNRLKPLADVVQNEGSGPNQERQDQAHAHCIRFSPDGKFVFGVDLGIDRVGVYRLNPQTGQLIQHNPPGFDTAPGAGPRHLAYAADGRFVYVANELDSTVTACTWDAGAGKLEAVQTLSTLEEGFHGENTAADTHITPSGKVLYVSNRGEDSLAAFRVDTSTGHLERIGAFSCGGESPRNFAIHPQGKFMLVANQKSGNVVVFEIAADGTLSPAGEEAFMPAPVCVIFAR